MFKKFKMFFGHSENPSGIIFNPIGKGESTFHLYSTINLNCTLINYRMITFNYFIDKDFKREYLIHPNYLGLLNVSYEIYSAYFIDYSNPKEMVKSLGLDPLQNISDNYFRIPSTIEPGFFSKV